MAESIEATESKSRDKASTLIRVLSQIRWPMLTGFDVTDVADALAKQLGKEYPLRDRVQETQVVLTPEGASTQAGSGVLHKFVSADGHWIVTLAPTFVTLETSFYTSHEDFIRRLVDVVGRLKAFLPLQRWIRFGYRYTNRIAGPSNLKDLPQLFAPAILGTIGSDFAAGIVHSASETVYESPEASLLVKSALLPPHAIMDPTIPPVPERTWVLDLDAFTMGPSSAFDDASIQRQASTLSEKAHGFFEAIVTSEFRNRFNA